MARYALIVGITEYSHLPKLTKAAANAEAIARLLEQHDNFENVKRSPADWLTSEKREAVSAQQQLTGESLGQVLHTFLLEQAASQDALIYFSGHGITTTDNLGEQEGYLSASDCQIEQKNGQLIEQRYGISLDKLNRLIRRSNLSSLVVLLDCCHSGYFLERHLTEQSLTAFAGRQDYCLITASRKFEQAWEGEQYSVFTEAVLKGLSPDNQDEDGNVTGDRLFASVARELRQSGQEPIRMGIGRSLTLVSYRTHTTAAQLDEACPYQGLEAFTAETAQFFFGRKALVEQLRQQLEHSNFVALIGASGSGKSSVVRAGLIPWLEELGWQILPPIKPGFQPIGKLKQTFADLFRRSQDIRQVHELIDAEGLAAVVNLLSGSGRLLLMVDQFEEVFTVCSDESERRRFIQLLTQVETQRLAVVITMRADFMEPCLNYTSLTQQLQDHTVLIPPLEGEGLREAIAKPAQLQGYTVDPGLLALILRDVAKEKNCLPLLQFTLQKLWEPATHNKHRLTIEQYDQLGGVTGALDRHAQQIYNCLKPQEQDWAKRLCLKLVRTGEGTRDTRQRQPKRELLGLAGDDPQAQATLEAVLTDLVDGRLLVTGEEKGEAWVDLAHEALMEGWQQFAAWRQSDRELRRLCDRIEAEMREWMTNRQDNDSLMSNRLLVQVTKRWVEIKPYLSNSTQEFYQRSYVHEREKISYETDINVFKEQLQELHTQLTAKLQAIEEESSIAEVFEKSAVSRQPVEESRLTTEQNSVKQAELAEFDTSNVVKLKEEVEDFLKRAERFEQRMHFAGIAESWLNKNQEDLSNLIVQYSLTKNSQLIANDSYANPAEKFQGSYKDVDGYMNWLRESLILGEPIEHKLETPTNFPKNVYIEAFRFIRQQWFSEELSDNVIKEIRLYLDYLIAYLVYFD